MMVNAQLWARRAAVLQRFAEVNQIPTWQTG
jgi:hypothetical protein